MTAYRRQHTVPASYQRSFSTDPAKRNRNSKVYKFSKADDCWTGPFRTEKQCWTADFYSAVDREESEKQLKVIEDDYAEWSEKVYEHGFASLTEEEVYNLALTMLALFVRNPVHRHTGVLPEERNRVSARYQYLGVLLAPNQTEGIREGSSEEVRLSRQDEILRRWSLHEVRAAAGSSFIYTDSPIVPCFVGSTGARTLAFLMPFDPEAIWIYTDEGVDVGATTATAADVDAVNQLVASHAIDAAFASGKIDPGPIRAGFASPFDIKSEFNTNGWTFEPFRITNIPWLSVVPGTPGTPQRRLRIKAGTPLV